MARILWVEKQIDYEPQGMMSLSAVLKQAGHEVTLTIAAQEDPAQVAKALRPDILAYTVLTGSQRYYLDLNRQIKRELGDQEPVSVFGGPHATFFADILQEPGLDGVCIGEGEGPIVDLANALDNGGRFFNLFTKTDDQKVETSEIARAAGVFSADIRAFVFFEMALLDLTPDVRKHLISHFSPDLMERYQTFRPLTVRPSLVESTGSAGQPAIVTGYPVFVENYIVYLVLIQ